MATEDRFFFEVVRDGGTCLRVVQLRPMAYRRELDALNAYLERNCTVITVVGQAGPR